MTQHHDLDRMLSTWLDDPYTPPAPPYLGNVLERTRTTRQRPAWASLERWLPMADKVLPRTTTRPLRLSGLLLLVLLVVALAAIVVVGSRLLSATTIPQGGSAVLAYGSMDGEIHTVRADGTDIRQLTTGSGAGSPAWSPDGMRIAYLRWDGTTTSVVVVDAGGDHRTTLATTPATQSYCLRGGPVWSPDGRSLVFPTSPDCDLRHELFVVATDGSSPAKGLLASGTDSVFASWSPDGKLIATFGSDAAGTGLYIVDTEPIGVLSGGLRPRRISPGPADLTDSSGGPRWSPDGSKLAGVDPSGVFIVNADGSGRRLVAERGVNPSWSPDGKQLAFHRQVDPSEFFNERPCTARIWIVDADGTHERRLDDLGDSCDAPPQWSPDGTRISGLLIASTIAEPALGPHLGVITVDGSRPTVLLQDGPAVTWQPVAAPIPPAPSFSTAPS